MGNCFFGKDCAIRVYQVQLDLMEQWVLTNPMPSQCMALANFARSLKVDPKGNLIGGGVATFRSALGAERWRRSNLPSEVREVLEKSGHADQWSQALSVVMLNTHVTNVGLVRLLVRVGRDDKDCVFLVGTRDERGNLKRENATVTAQKPRRQTPAEPEIGRDQPMMTDDRDHDDQPEMRSFQDPSHNSMRVTNTEPCHCLPTSGGGG